MMWCGSSAGSPHPSHGWVLTHRVYGSLTQRLRFGRNMNDSGDSGSIFSASTCLAVSSKMTVADTDGCMSDSRITDLIGSGGGNFKTRRAGPSGMVVIKSFNAAHQHNSGSVI